jgi:hypothetical protein
MRLPDEEETKLYEETKTIEETTAMPYITTAERKGIEKSLPTVHQTLATIIKIKFGEPGPQLE